MTPARDTVITLREGDSSPEVADVQRRLRELGHEVRDDAGVYGATTKQAVRAFQQERGILVDGIVGRHTWSELVEASWRLGDRQLYLRHPLMRGDDVADLQARLNALGFDPGRQDGIFGANTANAVRSFQKEYGVAEDGIFGPRSHAALLGLRVDRPGTAGELREELRRAERSGVHEALVVIDPGHGPGDPGEIGRRGNRESDLCWDLGARVAERLIGWGASVRFTRHEAEAPDLTERARRANVMQADVFLSIHLNFHEEPTAEGASTFYFPRSRSGEALAEAIQQHLSGLGLRDCRSHARSFPILKETRMPAVLIEPSFITNPDEEKKLEDTDFRDAIADAIVTALREYYEGADRSVPSVVGDQ